MADLIEMKVDDRELHRVFARKLKECDDLTPLMRALSGIMADSTEENFEHEGRPRWTPLRPRTIKARAAKGNWPGKILQVRGRLAASIITDHDRHSARIGTNLAYAAIQQLGGTTHHSGRQRIMHFTQASRGKITHGRPGTGDRFASPGKAHYAMRTMGKAYDVKMPARPFLQFTSDDLRRMRRKAEDYIGG
jgi:phage virion morphogenesis protein